MSRVINKMLYVFLVLSFLFVGCDSGSDASSSAPQGVGAPTISPNGGVFNAPVKVAILPGADASTLYCTTDGKDPGSQTVPGCGPILVAKSLTLKAVSGGYGLRSGISQAVFKIQITDSSIPWNSDVKYGSVVDARDMQSYKTVTIGSQTWMAENLRYNAPKSYCSNGDTSYCKYFGRMYSWASSMGLDSSFNGRTYIGSDKNVQGVCPSGWHLPSEKEWSILLDTTLSKSMAGRALKASTTFWFTNTGVDSLGFRALPAGLGNFGTPNPNTFTKNAAFWSSTQGSTGSSVGIRISEFNESEGYMFDKTMDFSVRCIR